MLLRLMLIFMILMFPLEFVLTVFVYKLCIKKDRTITVAERKMNVVKSRKCCVNISYEKHNTIP